MPNYLGEIFVTACVLAASVGPKLWLQHRSAQTDTEQLNRDVTSRLAAERFEFRIARGPSGSAIEAWRPDCRLMVWNGDRSRELRLVFQLAAAGYDPVLIGYRNEWRPYPAPARAVLERFAQDGAARIGIQLERPAVLALAQAGSCHAVQQALNGLNAHSSITGRR